jgi:hypothetical protein
VKRDEELKATPCGPLNRGIFENGAMKMIQTMGSTQEELRQIPKIYNRPEKGVCTAYATYRQTSCMSNLVETHLTPKIPWTGADDTPSVP